MPHTDSTPIRAMLKLDCPFSLKFRIFVTEAGIADQFVFDVFEEGTRAYDEAKATLEKCAPEATFPAVEISPGKYMADSDTLIDHFAEAFSVDHKALPLLAYYEAGVFRAMTQMFEENRNMKRKLEAA